MNMKCVIFLTFLATISWAASKEVQLNEEFYELVPWEVDSLPSRLFPQDSIQHFTVETFPNSGIRYVCYANLRKGAGCEKYFISLHKHGEETGNMYSCGEISISGYADRFLTIYSHLPQNNNSQNLAGFSCSITSHIKSSNGYVTNPPTSNFRTEDFVVEDSSEYGLNKEGLKPTTCPCGVANRPNAKSRIVNGYTYDPHKYPFIVGIHAYDENGNFAPICGGSIISKKLVLTAAHCTAESYQNSWLMKVSAGEHNRANYYETARVMVDVENIWQHEEFDPESLVNDISLLMLLTPLPFSREISPICLPKRGLDVIGKQVNVIGWGQYDINSPMTSEPAYIATKVIDRLECSREHKWVHYANPKQICTYQPDKSGCHGDSGGPVVWVDPETNRYTLVGLVSFGPPVCDQTTPTVHTQVEAFLDQIEQKIAEFNMTEEFCTRQD